MKSILFYIYYHSGEDMPIHVSDVIEEFALQNDDVHLFTSVRRSILLNCPWRSKIKVTRFPVVGGTLLNRLFYSVLLSCTLPVFCLLERPAVIYERASVSSLITVIISRLLSIPYVAEVNGVVVEELTLGRHSRWRIRLTRCYESLLYGLSDLIIAVNVYVKDWVLDAYRVPASKIEVLTNGTNVRRFRPFDTDQARSHFGLAPRGKHYVGYLGTLTPWCGVELLIECAPRVLAHLPDLEFLIGGGQQPYLNRFREQVAARGLQEHFRFFGAIPWSEAGLFISAFDVGVISIVSLNGLSPLKLYSYLACAKPVVGSNLGEVKEVLTRYRVGLLFEAGNPHSLGQKLIEIFDEPGARVQMGDLGRQLAVEQYSWGTKVCRLKQLIHNLVRASVSDGTF